jgi:hypothetical protein
MNMHNGEMITAIDKISSSDSVFVVKAVYESGDSFGRSTGNVEYICVTSSYKKAKEIAKCAENASGYTMTITQDGKKYDFFLFRGPGISSH